MPHKFLKFISLLICFSLIFEQSGFAQVAAQLDVSGYLTQLNSALIQEKFRPLHLRYLAYDQLNNNFKLLLDKGDLEKGLSPKGTVPEEKLKEQTRVLLNYFFVGISLPNDSFWVNLRPDSPQNIIDDWLAQTDVGRILLEADLQLKKDTASFTSPQTPEGKKYWDRLYKKAEELFGNENITIPTLTRPWIVPGEIIIRETPDNAYIYKATLKVMLEQDYLSSQSSAFSYQQYSFKDPRLKALNEYSTQLIKELVIPKLTKEVNSSKRYAPLRQVYYSLILAQWFKARFYGKGGLYSWLIDKKDLTNLTSKENWSKATYFKQYQQSFKDGEYSLKEPVSTPFGQSVRSYFSGGIAFNLGQLGSSPVNAGEIIKRGTIEFIKGNPNRGRGLGSSPLAINGKGVIALVTGGTPQNPMLQNIEIESEIKVSSPMGKEAAPSSLPANDFQERIATSPTRPATKRFTAFMDRHRLSVLLNRYGLPTWRIEAYDLGESGRGVAIEKKYNQILINTRALEKGEDDSIFFSVLQALVERDMIEGSGYYVKGLYGEAAKISSFLKQLVVRRAIKNLLKGTTYLREPRPLLKPIPIIDVPGIERPTVPRNIKEAILLRLFRGTGFGLDKGDVIKVKLAITNFEHEIDQAVEEERKMALPRSPHNAWEILIHLGLFEDRRIYRRPHSFVRRIMNNPLLNTLLEGHRSEFFPEQNRDMFRIIPEMDRFKDLVKDKLAEFRRTKRTQSINIGVIGAAYGQEPITMVIYFTRVVNKILEDSKGSNEDLFRAVTIRVHVLSRPDAVYNRVKANLIVFPENVVHTRYDSPYRFTDEEIATYFRGVDLKGERKGYVRSERIESSLQFYDVDLANITPETTPDLFSTLDLLCIHRVLHLLNWDSERDRKTLLNYIDSLLNTGGLLSIVDSQENAFIDHALSFPNYLLHYKHTDELWGDKRLYVKKHSIQPISPANQKPGAASPAVKDNRSEGMPRRKFTLGILKGVVAAAALLAQKGGSLKIIAEQPERLTDTVSPSGNSLVIKNLINNFKLAEVVQSFPEEISTLIKDLAIDGKRKLAVERLVLLGPRVVEPLVKFYALDSSSEQPDWLAGKAAIDVVRKLDQAAVKPLLGLLRTDDNWYTRDVSVLILNEISGPQATAALEEALHDSDISIIRLSAVRVLRLRGWIPDLSNLRVVVDYYTATAQWDNLVALGGPAASLLKEDLGDKRAGIRENAARALGHFEDSDINLLKKVLLTDSDLSVMYAAAESLDRLGWQPADNNERALYYFAQQDIKKLRQLGRVGIDFLLGRLKQSLEKDYFSNAAWLAETIYKLNNPAGKEAMYQLIKEKTWLPPHLFFEIVSGFGYPIDTQSLKQVFLNTLGSKYDELRKLGGELLLTLVDRQSHQGHRYSEEDLQRLKHKRDANPVFINSWLEQLAQFIGQDASGQELLNLYRESRKLNIHLPYRFSLATLRELVKNRQNPTSDARPLAVMIFPRSDWNDAFLDTQHIDKLIQHKYRVMFYEASNGDQWIEALKAGTNNQLASLLFVGGHGTQTSIQLGTASVWDVFVTKNQYIDLTDEKKLKAAGVSGRLLPEAQIILEACSVGKGRDKQDNIANMFRRIFSQVSKRGIWSSTIDGGIIELIFDEHNQLKEVRFTDKRPYRAFLDFPRRQNVPLSPFDKGAPGEPLVATFPVFFGPKPDSIAAGSPVTEPGAGSRPSQSSPLSEGVPSERQRVEGPLTEAGASSPMEKDEPPSKPKAGVKPTAVPPLSPTAKQTDSTGDRPKASAEIIRETIGPIYSPTGLGENYGKQLLDYLHELERSVSGFNYETVLPVIVEVLEMMDKDLRMQWVEFRNRHPGLNLQKLKFDIIKSALGFQDPRAIQAPTLGSGEYVGAVGRMIPLEKLSPLDPLNALKEAIRTVSQGKHPLFTVRHIWEEEAPENLPSIFAGGVFFILQERIAQRESLESKLDAKHLEAMIKLRSHFSYRIGPDDVAEIASAIRESNVPRFQMMSRVVEGLISEPGDLGLGEGRLEAGYHHAAEYLESVREETYKYINSQLEEVLDSISVGEPGYTLVTLVSKLRQAGLRRDQADTVLAAFTWINGSANYPERYTEEVQRKVIQLLQGHGISQDVIADCSLLIRTVYYSLNGEARSFDLASNLSKIIQGLLEPGSVTGETPGYVLEFTAKLISDFYVRWTTKLFQYILDTSKYVGLTDADRENQSYVEDKAAAIRSAIENKNVDKLKTELEEIRFHRWKAPYNPINFPQLARHGVKDLLVQLDSIQHEQIDWNRINREISTAGSPVAKPGAASRPKGVPSEVEGPAADAEKEGLCVTADTLLSLGDGRKVPIVKVKVGDEVLSLNEETQAIEPHRINGLLDMGVKPVFKLTTASGRSIKTTATHPYLTQMGWQKIGQLKIGEQIAVASDQEGMYSARNGNSSSWSGKTTKSLLVKSSGDGLLARSRSKAAFVWLMSLGSILRRIIPGWSTSGECTAKSLSCVTSTPFSEMAKLKTSPLDRPFGERTTSCPRLVRNDRSPRCTFSSSKKRISLLQESRVKFADLQDPSGVMQGCLHMLRCQFRVGVLDFLHRGAGLKHLENQIYHDSCPFKTGLPVADIGIRSNIIFNTHINFSPFSLLYHALTRLSSQFCPEAQAAQITQLAATSDILWDRIVSIEPLGSEHVYDIEVEGTHNFIANGIFAHNTYMTGAASPAEDKIPTVSSPLSKQAQAVANRLKNLRQVGFLLYENAEAKIAGEIADAIGMGIDTDRHEKPEAALFVNIIERPSEQKEALQEDMAEYHRLYEDGIKKLREIVQQKQEILQKIGFENYVPQERAVIERVFARLNTLVNFKPSSSPLAAGQAQQRESGIAGSPLAKPGASSPAEPTKPSASPSMDGKWRNVLSTAFEMGQKDYVDKLNLHLNNVRMFLSQAAIAERIGVPIEKARFSAIIPGDSEEKILAFVEIEVKYSGKLHCFFVVNPKDMKTEKIYIPVWTNEDGEHYLALNEDIIDPSVLNVARQLKQLFLDGYDPSKYISETRLFETTTSYPRLPGIPLFPFGHNAGSQKETIAMVEKSTLLRHLLSLRYADGLALGGDILLLHRGAFIKGMARRYDRRIFGRPGTLYQVATNGRKEDVGLGLDYGHSVLRPTALSHELAHIILQNIKLQKQDLYSKIIEALGDLYPSYKERLYAPKEDELFAFIMHALSLVKEGSMLPSVDQIREPIYKEAVELLIQTGIIPPEMLRMGNFKPKSSVASSPAKEKAQEELQVLGSLMKDPVFLEEMARHLLGAYNRATGNQYTIRDDNAPSGLTRRDLDIAMNLAGFIGLEVCATGLLLTTRKGQHLVDILKDISAENLSKDEKTLLSFLVHSTWKAGVPFRVKVDGAGKSSGPYSLIKEHASFIPVGLLKDRIWQEDMVQIKVAAGMLLSRIENIADPKEQLTILEGLLKDEQFLATVATSSLEAYNAFKKTNFSIRDDTAPSGLTARDLDTAMNLAGFIALEVGAGYLLETSRKGESFSDVLSAIVENRLSLQENTLLMLFANATWKAGVPFRVKVDGAGKSLGVYSRVIEHPDFVRWTSLSLEEQTKDIVQVEAAAAKLLLEKMRPVGAASPINFMKRNEKAVYVAIQGMQHERWVRDEIDTESERFSQIEHRPEKDVKEELLRKYANVTAENYGQALDRLIAKFGKVTFVRVVMTIFKRHLKGLHVDRHSMIAVYKPHSDVEVDRERLGKSAMGLARQAIEGIHPVPETMRWYYNQVNVKTLFGDVDFWRHMQTEHPECFQELIANLTSDMRRAIEIYFPDANNIIKEVSSQKTSSPAVSSSLAKPGAASSAESKEWYKRSASHIMDPEIVRVNFEKMIVERAGKAPRSTYYTPGEISTAESGYLRAATALNKALHANNIDSAYDFQELIKSWHRIINDDSEGAGEYQPGNDERISLLLKNLFNTIINDSNVFDVIADAFYQLHAMHPFSSDGNRRVISLIINFILLKVGYGPFYLNSDNVLRYRTFREMIRRSNLAETETAKQQMKTQAISEIKDFFKSQVKQPTSSPASASETQRTQETPLTQTTQSVSSLVTEPGAASSSSPMTPDGERTLRPQAAGPGVEGAASPAQSASSAVQKQTASSPTTRLSLSEADELAGALLGKLLLLDSIGEGFERALLECYRRYKVRLEREQPAQLKFVAQIGWDRVLNIHYDLNYCYWLKRQTNNPYAARILELFTSIDPMLTHKERQEVMNTLLANVNFFYFDSKGKKVNMESYLRDYYKELGVGINIVLETIPAEIKKDVIKKILLGSLSLDETREILNILDVKGIQGIQEHPKYAKFSILIQHVLEDSVAFPVVKIEHNGQIFENFILAAEVTTEGVKPDAGAVTFPRRDRRGNIIIMPVPNGVSSVYTLRRFLDLLMHEIDHLINQAVFPIEERDTRVFTEGAAEEASASFMSTQHRYLDDTVAAGFDYYILDELLDRYADERPASRPYIIGWAMAHSYRSVKGDKEFFKLFYKTEERANESLVEIFGKKVEGVLESRRKLYYDAIGNLGLLESANVGEPTETSPTNGRSSAASPVAKPGAASPAEDKIPTVSSPLSKQAQAVANRLKNLRQVGFLPYENAEAKIAGEIADAIGMGIDTDRHEKPEAALFVNIIERPSEQEEALQEDMAEYHRLYEDGIKKLRGIVQQKQEILQKIGFENYVPQERAVIERVFARLNTLVNFKPSSSPIQVSGKGGIDFRGLPIVTQPGGFSSPLLLRDSPLQSRKVDERGQSLSNVNLHESWRQIQNMLQAGIIPSSERIREYLQACCSREDSDKEIDKVLACIADILRLEEERCEATDSALKEMLVLLESDKPASQMPAALSSIAVLPKEPMVAK